jgi:hypothetical protein
VATFGTFKSIELPAEDGSKKRMCSWCADGQEARWHDGHDEYVADCSQVLLDLVALKTHTKNDWENTKGVGEYVHVVQQTQQANQP